MNIGKHTVAVITGAASGIGRALAIRLAREGANLAISDVNASGLVETARLASDFGGRITTHVVDVSDKEAMHAFAAEVEQQHGHVSLLINNAGVAILGTAQELSIEDYEWLMGINFWGVIYGTKNFLPLLQKEPEAGIVNISSIFGIVAPIGQSAYCAAKFGVRGFTEALRHELGGTNVRVMVVHPGGIRTNIAAKARYGASAVPEDHVQAVANFEQVARTTPDQAAETIVRGIQRNRKRILVGMDAKIISLLQKLFPVRYWRVMGPYFERKLGTPVSREA